MEIAVVEVQKSKLDALEKDSEFLQLIREKSKLVEDAESDYLYAKNKSLEKKKTFDTMSAELHQLIEEGPPKPDPQGRLPFASDDASGGPPVQAKPSRSSGEVVGENDLELDDDGGSEKPEAAQSTPEAVEVPSQIEQLDLTARQKQMLAKTGAVTLADLVDLGNGNWSDYPKGFASIKGLGAAAVAKLAAQLPSTSPEHQPQPGELPPETKKIKLLTFAAGNDNLSAGDVYDATVKDDGVAIVSLPGQEPVEFQTYEYELVT